MKMLDYCPNDTRTAYIDAFAIRGTKY